MSTQLDFDNLIARINTSTDTLEDAVDVVVSGGEGYVTEAQLAAGESAQSALEAEGSAEASSLSAQEAEQAAMAAIEAKDTLLATVPYGDAPSNGITYGRKDAAWVAVAAGSESGVLTVNGVAPVDGDVNLSFDDLDNLPVLFDGDYNNLDNLPVLFDGDYDNLSNKPIIPLVEVQEAPLDGRQYARQDGEWEVVDVGDAGGGGEATGSYYNLSTWEYNPTLHAALKSGEVAYGAVVGSVFLSNTQDVADYPFIPLGAPLSTNNGEYVDYRCFVLNDVEGWAAWGGEWDENSFDAGTGMVRTELTGSAIGLFDNTNLTLTILNTIPEGNYSIPLSIPAGVWTARGLPTGARTNTKLLQVRRWGKTPNDCSFVLHLKDGNTWVTYTLTRDGVGQGEWTTIATVAP